MNSKNKISLRVLDGQTEVAEEELKLLVSFFQKWSREFFTAIAIVGVGFLAVHFFKDANLRQQKTSAQKFEEVRSTYQELQAATASLGKATGDDIKKTQTKIDDAKNRITEQLKVLGDAREPYKTLGALYQALVLLETNDIEGAKSLAASLDVANKLSKSDPENLPVELAAVTLGRTLIDSEATYQQGWDLLKTISEQGAYASVQALKTLDTIASSDAEKKTVTELRAKVLEKHPAMAEMVGNH